MLALLPHREPPLLQFVRRQLEVHPYEPFCAAHGIQSFHDFPVLMMQSLLKKGSSFETLVLANAFVPEPLKGYLFDIFVHAKRQVLVIRRAVVKWARQRRRSQTNVDLSLAPFGSPSTRMDVFDQGKKYTFKISDMLNLIHSSLTHSIEFICDPVPIRNPYTGLEFRKPTLYSIYVMLRESTYAVPPLFVLYMGVDFDIERFETQYESLLRDYVIKANIENLTPAKRREEIRQMMGVVGVFNPLSNRHEPIFRVLCVRPDELDQFKPWLHLYFVHLYSLNTYYAHVAFRNLIRAMLHFRQENPTFGYAKKG